MRRRFLQIDFGYFYCSVCVNPASVLKYEVHACFGCVILFVLFFLPGGQVPFTEAETAPERAEPAGLSP